MDEEVKINIQTNRDEFTPLINLNNQRILNQT